MLCNAPAHNDAAEFAMDLGSKNCSTGLGSKKCSGSQIPSWFSDVLTDVHFQTQEEFAKLDKRVRDQDVDFQRLAQSVGCLSSRAGKLEVGTANLAQAVATLAARVEELSVAVHFQKSTQSEPFKGPSGSGPQVTLEEQLCLDEPTSAPAPGRTEVRHRQQKRSQTSPSQVSPSQASPAMEMVSTSALEGAQSCTVKDLEKLKADVIASVAEKLHKVETQVKMDLQGLQDIVYGMGTGVKETVHFTDTQLDFLQKEYHFFGISNCLFALDAAHLPSEGREKVRGVLMEQRGALEGDLNASLIEPLEDPLLHVRDEVDYHVSKAHFWHRAFTSHSVANSSERS